MWCRHPLHAVSNAAHCLPVHPCLLRPCVRACCGIADAVARAPRRRVPPCFAQTITGTNFAAAFPSELDGVWIGTSATAEMYTLTNVTVLSDTQLLATTPPGFGRGLSLLVGVGGQLSTPSDASRVSYALPSILTMSSTSTDTLPPVTAVLTVTGECGDPGMGPASMG